jgi:hypothetical protein
VPKHLYVFRPGEEARMLARAQSGISKDGRCGATLTYPIRGYPWRLNPVRSYEFEISKEKRELLFAEVHRIRKEFPEQCLSTNQLFSDRSEKVNGITRDRETRTLCYTIGIMVKNEQSEDYYALREDSEALLTSAIYRTS